MQAVRTGLQAALVNLGLLACLGCGGGGGGSTPAPVPEPTNKVTVSLPPPSRVGGGSWWVACQDGQGIWKVLTGVPSGPNTTTYSFQVSDPGGRYGLAVVDVYPVGGGNGSLGLLHQATLAEGRALDYSTLGPVATALVQGSLAGVLPADGGRISSGSTTKTLNAGSTVTTLTAKVGATDFVAARLPGMGTADSLVVRRGYPVSGTDPVSITFDFATGWPLVAQSLAATGVAGGESLTLQADWATPGTSIKLAEGSVSPLSFKAAPVDRMQPGDLHALRASAHDSTGWTYRHAMAYSLSAANISLALPPSPPIPSFGTAAGTALYYRPVATWTALAGAMVHDFLFGDPSAYLDWEIHLSKGWLGNGTALTYTFPDFAGAPGWNSAWGLPFGRDLHWHLGQRQTSYVDPGFYFAAPRAYVVGQTAWEVLAYGGLNMPPSAGEVRRVNPPTDQAPQVVRGAEGGPWLRSHPSD